MIRDERGSVLSVEFLIVSVLIFALAFGAVDYWLVQVKAQQAEHVKNYYLDRMRIEGQLTPEDRDEMLETLDSMGFEVVEMDTHDGVKLRNAQTPDEAEVWLRMKLKLRSEPFLMGRLLGLGGEDEFAIKVGGVGLSEKVE